MTEHEFAGFDGFGVPNPDPPESRYAKPYCSMVNLMTGEQCRFDLGHSGGHDWEYRLPSDVVVGTLTPDPPVDAALTVIADDGTLLFRISAEGTLLCPDPDRAAEAAGIFWREVTRLAQSMGWRVEWFQDEGERNDVKGI